ncbi:MAG: bifunctional folylpolyglutamate synthase/dihydrofolate synthase [Bacteroidales bacterium]|nr:bifunctional folylpolyglutamate synthase/dihydrofolate synthase [Bacteroidales bacterium]MCF8337384.1 bifunctional folylpolyglutamate synthase/dihydrofolate synthase [Bacteroidales bacterium]
MNYKQALDWMISQLPMFQRAGRPAFKPDLSKSWEMMRLLNNPQKQFRSIHIAGTNGKGSTAHYLASIFMESGLKVGLYTSPHLKDFRERIRVNRNLIEKDYVADFTEKFYHQFENLALSFFEMTVGLAFSYFASRQVDIAIVEVGMGGRLDSTNVIIPELSIITNIGLDHTYFLGETLPEIAGEKAGIIKKDVPVLIGRTQEATFPVFEQKASEVGTETRYADRHFKLSEPVYRQIGEYYDKMEKDGEVYLTGIFNPLAGSYQHQNIITAIAAADSMATSFGINYAHIKSGIKNVIENTGLQGRWQVLNRKPLVICDTGHNSDGIRMITKQLLSLNKDHIHFVLSTVNDKNLTEVLSLLPESATYYFCKADIPRGLPVEELMEKAAKEGLKGEAYPSVKAAFEAAKANARENDVVFVGGSTFTVAEIL